MSLDKKETGDVDCERRWAAARRRRRGCAGCSTGLTVLSGLRWHLGKQVRLRSRSGRQSARGRGRGRQGAA